jgi:quinolinate synthase
MGEAAMEGQALTQAARRGPVARFAPLPMPSLDYTREVADETAHLYEKVRHVIPAIEWPAYAPTIAAINRLKRERNVVILAHNYQTPDIFYGVADIVGDSLQLAREAARTDAEVIVQCGVHFMAETSKILCPDKTVLIPDMRAGCSLAESITGADVRLLRERYPGVPIVTYVNTSAEVKAESDITCTSSNAVQVVESFGVDRVLLIPDEYLALNVAKQTKVKIVAWKGHCEVHERFTAEELLAYKEANPGLEIIAHPECPPEVVAIADFTGSTSSMIRWVHDRKPPKAMLVTECSMASNVQADAPGTEFIMPCNLCPHMKRITLPKILDSLLYMKEEVTVDPAVAVRARRAVERMINLKS